MNATNRMAQAVHLCISISAVAKEEMCDKCPESDRCNPTFDNQIAECLRTRLKILNGEIEVVCNEN